MEDFSVAEFVLSQAEGLRGNDMGNDMAIWIFSYNITPFGPWCGVLPTNKMWREEKVRRPGGCYSDPSPR